MRRPWPSSSSTSSSHGLLVAELKQTLDTLEQQHHGTVFGRPSPAQLLRQCGRAQSLRLAVRAHVLLVRCGLVGQPSLRAPLVEMFGRCGSPQYARAAFDTTPPQHRNGPLLWNVMMAAYVRAGCGPDALALLAQMLPAGVRADGFTFATALGGCAALAEVKSVHAHVHAAGAGADVVLASALVNAYGNRGSLVTARAVFDSIPPTMRNIYTWNIMIATCVRDGQSTEPLELFSRMHREGVKPDGITFSGILGACTNLLEGKRIHAGIADAGAGAGNNDAILDTALVKMYGSCGSLNDANRTFRRMQRPLDVIPWNAVIAAFAQNGRSTDALELFAKMLCESVRPNCITFMSVLSACSRAGLVDEGRRHFNSMCRVYGIDPTSDHYVCMVDLLGRSGLLNEAEGLINNMPFPPVALHWLTLLGACRLHADADRGVRAAERVFELDPKNSAPYVLLSNIFAAAGRWEDVAALRELMRSRGVKKQPGCSWIEVKSRVHEFLVGDKTHPRIGEIHAELQRLSMRMKEAGYVPDTSVVLHDTGEEEKEEMLRFHSEKLAIAYGIISTPPGALIHITKNLRVCTDCHTAAKFISKIVGRKIVVRDANRFHHFQNGLCSCGDYF